MDFYNELEKLCKTVEREIEDVNEKIRKSGGKVSPADMEYVDKLTHTIKSLKTTMAMMDAGSEYNGIMSYRAPKRDSMGRYSRNDGSYRSYDDGIVHELRDLMNRTHDDRIRSEIGDLVARME